MATLTRVLASLMAGIIFTVIGFRFIVFHAPVWVASFIVAKTGLHATNVTLNLTYLMTNVFFWGLIAYIAFAIIAKRKQGVHGKSF